MATGSAARGSVRGARLQCDFTASVNRATGGGVRGQRSGLSGTRRKALSQVVRGALAGHEARRRGAL